MALNLPSISELKRAAESGQRITPEDVAAISQTERRLSGGNSITGGSAATAQSLAMRQMSFDAKRDEISRKSESDITQEDADEIQLAEARAFHKTPGPGSVSAQIRSIADRNEALGLPTGPGDVPVYVTKDEAREAQQAESAYEGSIASQIQGAADKLDARRNSS
ncbi:hypothetical protein BDV25DRAFT_139169 [Aspergillus avenaceus]|uniref:SMP domain-containing protein n=1 Tax=Aspergillus avenaceus TaxID=36643 RepID=A0A5N6TYC3_ASPAV|nr:hypothetical protein BDV25DRAFT_139169 [Aspergillus avenaceus]